MNPMIKVASKILIGVAAGAIVSYGVMKGFDKLRARKLARKTDKDVNEGIRSGTFDDVWNKAKDLEITLSSPNDLSAFYQDSATNLMKANVIVKDKPRRALIVPLSPAAGSLAVIEFAEGHYLVRFSPDKEIGRFDLTEDHPFDTLIQVSQIDGDYIVSGGHIGKQINDYHSSV